MRYAPLRLEAGRYLQASDDRLRLFLIESYPEEGTLVRRDGRGRDHPVRGTFWRVSEVAEPGPGGRAVFSHGLLARLERGEARTRELAWGYRTKRAALAELPAVVG
jgi:hypothetical protein